MRAAGAWLLCVLAGQPARAEQARLEAPGGLHVDMTWQGSIEKLRCVDQLTIDAGRGQPLKLRCQWTEAGGLEDFVPLFNDVLELGPQRWLLLGWSWWTPSLLRSYAWIVEAAPDGVKLVDRLEVATDSRSGGFALEVKPGHVRVGVSRPDQKASGFELVLGKKHLDGAAFRALPASRGKIDRVYTGLWPRKSGWGGGFAWFNANPAGFSLARR